MAKKTVIFILFRSGKLIMSKERDIQKFLDEGEAMFLPSLSVDCVIFGFHDNVLKVLLLKMRHLDKWSLPGGFILHNEHTEAAAARVLKERTGLSELFLQQFHVFGEPNRSDKSVHIKSMKAEGIVPDPNHWILKRFVTIGYYALVEFSHVKPIPDELSDACEWCSLDNIPSLMMDHRQILDKALEALRLHLNYHPVGYNLLPATFTMPQLQKLYETILGKKLDRRNFQRKMLGYKILKRMKERKRGGAHKSPYLYCFDLKKYHKALKEGLQGGW
jgi:8-oxo-dGTP diphosphatase